MWLGPQNRHRRFLQTIVIGSLSAVRLRAMPDKSNANLDHEDIHGGYDHLFVDPVRATLPEGKPVIVNGRPHLIPDNLDLQNEMNAARYAATQVHGLSSWFPSHYAHGSSGDPQRQAGY